MAGLFGLLELGKRTLIAQQFAQNIVGNNISNVNTDGYSRQQTQFNQIGTIDTPWGKIGLGVQIQNVERSRDALVDKSYRDAHGALAQWQTRANILQKVDTIFTEEDQAGLGSKMDAFFNAWEDLANDPESLQPRLALKQRGIALTDTFHRIANKLKEQKVSTDNRISNLVDEANSLIKKIATLNGKIPSSATSAGQSNELLDQRDQLIDRLAEIVNVKVIESTDKGVSIFIGAINVVQGGFYHTIQTQTESGDGMTKTVLYSPSGTPLDVSSGELKGLLDLRDEILPSYSDSLNTLAKSMVDQVNAYHKVGYTLDGDTGINFFDTRYTTADAIKLDDEILDEPKKIIAAAEDAEGDGTQALRIAKLKDAPLLNGSSYSDFYSGLITQIGVDGQSALDAAKSQEILARQTAIQREEVSGVSLDEEMINMIKFQQSYLAAARMISTIDSMIEAIISLK
ncbi:MAG: flagellar hook-associated protein FlgK [Calditrichaeota bacterium]|nr:MAG: flagellar hook-associated protein FlgK [Calditrichota bacterium]